MYIKLVLPLKLGCQNCSKLEGVPGWNQKYKANHNHNEATNQYNSKRVVGDNMFIGNAWFSDQ